MTVFEPTVNDRRVSSWVIVLVCLATLTHVSPGAAESAQSCSDVVEPQDVESISTAAQVPSAYAARVNAGDAEHLSRLFATDVVFRGGRGQVLNGRAAVRALFDEILGGAGPRLGVGRVVADDRRVAFELIRLGGPCNEEDPATALDFMEINEQGEIVSFTAFLRPQPQ